MPDDHAKPPRDTESGTARDLLSIVESLRKQSLEERAQRASQPAAATTAPTAKAKAKKASQPAQQLLPFWADTKRPAIHYMVRSALFTCAQKSPRRMIRSDSIESLGYFKLGYQGEELRQRDLDVLMQLLHLNRGAAATDFATFSARSMITSLGWTKGGRSYEELEESIRRMQACSVTVSTEGSGEEIRYSGTIVAEFMEREAGEGAAHRMWAVRLNPHIARLLGPGGYTSVEWETRLKLPPLAKGLAVFFQSHRAVYPVGVETLYRLTGVEYRELRYFKRDLIKALEALVEHQVLLEFHIDENQIVHVRRPDDGERAALA